jgi:hypothetical protein
MGMRAREHTLTRELDGAPTFRVGVRIAPVRGGGRLTVAPGAIVVDVGRATRALSRVREIVHTDGGVALVTARLVPPWFNTSLVVSDGRTSAQVALPIWARGRLRAALDDAGFDIRETTTWFSLTGGQPESGRPRPPGAQLAVPRSAIASALLSMVAVLRR